MVGPVLIVDDDADVRSALRDVLSGVGTVLEASNGADALRMIESQRPRLMLLDIGLPEMGGIDVLRTALRIDPTMAILMLTAECDIAVATNALRLGARAYITKPFDESRLRAEVESLLRSAAADGREARGKPWRVLDG